MSQRTGLEDVQDRLPLGRISPQPTHYDPSVLVGVPRQLARNAESVDATVFQGHDLWNAWEVSWLNPSGRPEARIGQLIVPASSPNLCESKSLKLYLNSFANERLTEHDLCARIQADLTECLGVEPTWRVHAIEDPRFQVASPKGECMDQLAVDVRADGPDARLLQILSHTATQARYYTHLFRSNCPVTGQPDWATVVVKYAADVALHPASLLAYLISYRNHTGFHEACIERIFQDLNILLNPTELVVWAGFVRRGGLDINPVRALSATNFLPPRLARH
jgi:7-cyano-7-deazaguanine reductase